MKGLKWLFCSVAIVATAACSSVDSYRIPAHSVFIDLSNAGLWNTYGVAGYGECRMFSKDKRIPANFPYTERTSTGFGGAGATFADVELFARHVGPAVKIKAAGGIASLEDAEKFLELGLIGTQFNREYWDLERENRGINNYFVPEEMGILLKKMYDRTLIDAESSQWLENILRQQQINHKMGGFLPMDFPMAHKTGDEEDKAHDVGIVFAEKPFILCYAYIGNNMQVYEDFIRRTTRTLAEDAGSIEAVMARLTEQE